MCGLSFSIGLVSHSDLDDRAIEALKEFNEEGALQVLLQFKDSDLSHVQVRTCNFLYYLINLDAACQLLRVNGLYPACCHLVLLFHNNFKPFLFLS